MQFGYFPYPEQRLQFYAKSAHQREQRRGQHFALVHVDDSVGPGCVKADMQAFGQPLDLEHGAAARVWRHDDGHQNLGVHAGFYQRVLDNGALCPRIIGCAQVMQQTAAAGTKMPADFVQAIRPVLRLVTSLPRPSACSTVRRMPSEFRPASAYIFSTVS